MIVSGGPRCWPERNGTSWNWNSEHRSRRRWAPASSRPIWIGTLPDGGRADIFDLMFALVREYGLALRVASPPAIRKVQAMGLPTPDYGMLDSYHLPTENKTARYI